jgi:hypothetical protein
MGAETAFLNDVWSYNQQLIEQRVLYLQAKRRPKADGYCT